MNIGTMNADQQKVITYIFLNGKIQQFNEIAKDHSRTYKAGNSLIKKGLLIRDNGIDINYKKFPAFKTLREEYFKSGVKDNHAQNIKFIKSHKGKLLSNEETIGMGKKMLNMGFDPKKE